MKVLYWNVYVGHDPDNVVKELRGMVAEFKPEVVGLGEAGRIANRIHRARKANPKFELIRGYHTYYLEETYRGEGGTLALVRKDVDLRAWNWKKFTKWWIGPKNGAKQGPKRFWNGRIRDDRLGLVRLSIGHWPFNLALPEVEEWAVEWFKRPLVKRASVHLGDVNMQEPETDRFVKRFGGKNVGVRLDRALFKNCNVRVRDLGKHGSDHPAVLFTITK